MQHALLTGLDKQEKPQQTDKRTEDRRTNGQTDSEANGRTDGEECVKSRSISSKIS